MVEGFDALRGCVQFCGWLGLEVVVCRPSEVVESSVFVWGSGVVGVSGVTNSKDSVVASVVVVVESSVFVVIPTKGHKLTQLTFANPDHFIPGTPQIQEHPSCTKFNN